jgi:hypothetical protein
MTEMESRDQRRLVLVTRIVQFDGFASRNAFQFQLEKAGRYRVK